MSKKKIILSGVAALLLVPALFDAIRYLKSDADRKQLVQAQNSFPVSSATEIILVYNAWGGIYPGLVDFVNKEFFPKSYPCNLCYQTFGTFSMKKEWKHYLEGLPYKKRELHKDNFQRLYKPENLALPVILITNGSNVQVLASAEELNQQRSLEALIEVVNYKLRL
jgi:hypothetical protein